MTPAPRPVFSYDTTRASLISSTPARSQARSSSPCRSLRPLVATLNAAAHALEKDLAEQQ